MGSSKKYKFFAKEMAILHKVEKTIDKSKVFRQVQIIGIYKFYSNHT
jgi:hypothetical protein